MKKNLPLAAPFDSSPIRAIRFDAFGTTCCGGAWGAVLAWHEKLPREKRCRIRNDWMAGKLAPCDLLAYGDHASAPLRPEFEQQLRTEGETVELFDDTSGVLGELQRRGYRLVTISSLIQESCDMVRQRLGVWMDGLVLSCEIGARKPDIQLFDAAFVQLDLPAGRILMVGDSAYADISGARAAGMSSVFVDRRARSSDGIPTL